MPTFFSTSVEFPVNSLLDAGLGEFDGSSRLPSKKWDVRRVVFVVVGSVNLDKKNNPNTCILIATLMNSKILWGNNMLQKS